MSYLVIIHVLAFSLGAIPVGYLLAKFRGIDIRTKGSGNVGATNVSRALGKSAGVLTLVLDALKGALATLIPYALANVPELEASAPLLAPSVGFFAILGHCFSPFLKGKGGKGVATSLGVFLVLSPLATLAACATFAITVGVTRVVSLGSLMAALLLPIAVAAEHWSSAKEVVGGGPKIVVAVLTATLVIVRHRSNIGRLLKREELRI